MHLSKNDTELESERMPYGERLKEQKKSKSERIKEDDRPKIKY